MKISACFFLRSKSVSYFFIFVLFSAITSCSDSIISLSEAERLIQSRPSPTDRFDRNQGHDLFAYSIFSLSLPNGISTTLQSGNLSYRIDIEKVTALMTDNTPVQIKYEIVENSNIITISPDEYFSKSGRMQITVHFKWRYWERTDQPPSSDITIWKDFKEEAISVVYDVFARVAPLNVFDEDNPQSINVSIYHAPQVKVAYLPGSIVENLYRYELEVSLGNFTLQPIIDEENMIITYNFDGLLQAHSSYTFTARAKWYRYVEGSWIRCAEKFDEIFTQNIITSEQANMQWTMQDIEFMYPLYRQFNFLPGEYNKGYIRLTDALVRQYTVRPPFVEFRDVKTGWIWQANVSFNQTLQVFEYEMPQVFEPEKIYQISFKDRATDAVIFSYHFKTSKFNNFTEKWASLRSSFTSKWRWPVLGEGGMLSHHEQGINMQNLAEPFDMYETNHVGQSPYPIKTLPLIRFNSHILEHWKGTMNWYIYSQPSLTFDRQTDEVNWFSFPPTDAIHFGFRSTTLSDDAVLTGNINQPSNADLGQFVWLVKAVSDLDVRSAAQHASRVPENARTQAQRNLASLAGAHYPVLVHFGNFPILQQYPVLQIDMAIGGDAYPLLDVYYVLPGLEIKTTTIRNVQL